MASAALMPAAVHVLMRAHLADGRDAVVKRLADADPAPDGAAERLRWEGACLTRLAGAPNVVKCYSVDAGAPALVLEYAAAGSLAATLAVGASRGVGRLLSTDDVVALGGALAAALEAVHAAGLVHRDVKPSNILLRTHDLTRPDAACLADFGVAAPAGSPGTLGVGWTEEAVGTLGYAAPEQLAEPATAVHPAADVYGLGVVLYELVTGRLPHELAPGEDEDEVALRARIVAGAAPVPPTAYRPSLAPAVARIIQRAIAHDPTRRPGAAELRRAWYAAWDSAWSTASDDPAELDGGAAQPPSSATMPSIPGHPSRL